MLRLPSRVTALLLVAGLVLAGCSGDEPVTDQGAVAGEGADSADVLAAAAETSAGESVRFQLTSTATTPQGEVVTTGQGVTAPDGTGRFTLTISGAGAQVLGAEGPLELETILVDGIVYQRNSALLGRFGSDAEWYSIDPSATVPGFEQLVEQAVQADPTEILQILREAGQVEEIGPEQVNGTSTTHYRGQVELAVLLEWEGVDPAALGTGTGDPGTERLVPIDVWVDAEGRVRRTVQRLDVQGIATRTLVDILEYGVPVDVEPPPADVTVSLTELLEQLQQDTGSNGGSG